jgi:amino acid permease
MVAYTIIAGQTLPSVFDQALGESFLSHRTAVVLLVTFTITLPLSLNKRLERLSQWSAIGLLGVVVVVLAVAVRGTPGTLAVQRAVLSMRWLL